MTKFAWMSVLITVLSAHTIVLQAYGQDVESRSSTLTREGVARIEVGFQFTNRGLFGQKNPNGSFSSPPGRAVGPSVAVNINRNFAIDTMFSLSPGYETSADYFTDGSVAGGRSIEVLAGPRVEVRRGGLGVFAAARGGFLSWSHVLQDENYTSPYLTAGTLRYGAGYYPLLEGVVGAEYALTPRIRLRGEVGDQAIGYHSQTIEIPQRASQQNSGSE